MAKLSAVTGVKGFKSTSLTQFGGHQRSARPASRASTLDTSPGNEADWPATVRISIEDGMIYLEAAVPTLANTKMLDAYTDVLKEEFIKKIEAIAALPSNFATPFLRKQKQKINREKIFKRQLLKISSNTKIARAENLLVRTELVPRERLNTKEAQLTIGLTLSNQIYELLEGISFERRESMNKIAGEFLLLGLNVMSDRLNVEDEDRVFAHFDRVNSQLKGESSRRWMIRIDRKMYNRISLIAHEFGKSMANVAMVCIAHALHTEKRAMPSPD